MAQFHKPRIQELLYKELFCLVVSRKYKVVRLFLKSLLQLQLTTYYFLLTTQIT